MRQPIISSKDSPNRDKQKIVVIVSSIYFFVFLFSFAINLLTGILACVGFIFVYNFIIRSLTQIEIYEETVTIESGLVVKSANTINRSKIEGVTITKDLFGFNCLVLSTIGGEKIEIPCLDNIGIFEEILSKQRQQLKAVK